MIWILLLLTTASAFAVFESLFELVGVVLFLLHSAIEALAGKQVAAILILLILGAGSVVAVRYFESPTPRPSPRIAAAHDTSIAADDPPRPRPRRARARRIARACGTAAAPLELDPITWSAYTCRLPREAECLAWSAYTRHRAQGCSGQELCCPPLTRAAENTGNSVDGEAP